MLPIRAARRQSESVAWALGCARRRHSPGNRALEPDLAPPHCHSPPARADAGASSQLGQLGSWGSFLVGRGGQKRERLVQVVGPPSAWGFGQDLGQARADSAQTSAAPLRNQEPPVLQTAPKGLWLLLKKRSFLVTSLQTKPDGGGRNLWSVRLETHCGSAAGAHPPQTGRWPSCWASTWEEGSLFR